MDFSRFAQKVTDNRNEMRLGIFFALQVPIFLDTGYETAIVGVLAVLSAVVCLCHIYSLRQRDECFSNAMVLKKSSYSIFICVVFGAVVVVVGSVMSICRRGSFV